MKEITSVYGKEEYDIANYLSTKLATGEFHELDYKGRVRLKFPRHQTPIVIGKIIEEYINDNNLQVTFDWANNHSLVRRFFNVASTRGNVQKMKKEMRIEDV